MAASKAFGVNLAIDQGSTFHKVIGPWKTGTPTPTTVVDLTGATARAQFREAIDSTAVLVSLTTEDGHITLGGALGTITIDFTAAETAAFTSWDKAVYDLEIVFANGTVRRLLAGKVSVSPEVTR